MAVGNAFIKGIECPVGISFLSQSQSTLKPKPEVTLSQSMQWPSRLPTRCREYHIGYLCRHLREVRYRNRAPLPISVPLDKISKDNVYCRFPDEDIVALREAWPHNSSVLSPLIVLSGSNTLTKDGEFLTGFEVLSNLRECHAALKDSLNG